MKSRGPMGMDPEHLTFQDGLPCPGGGAQFPQARTLLCGQLARSSWQWGSLSWLLPARAGDQVPWQVTPVCLGSSFCAPGW